MLVDSDLMTVNLGLTPELECLRDCLVSCRGFHIRTTGVVGWQPAQCRRVIAAANDAVGGVSYEFWFVLYQNSDNCSIEGVKSKKSDGCAAIWLGC